MNTAVEKKPRLTTSAMIASIAGDGQRVKTAPFGKALVELAATRPEIVGMTADWPNTPTCTFSRRPTPSASTRWAWPSNC